MNDAADGWPLPTADAPDALYARVRDACSSAGFAEANIRSRFHLPDPITLGTISPRPPLMQTFRLSDLLSFEKTLSLTLLRIVYFLGLAGIGIAVIVTLLGGLTAMRYSFVGGLGTLIMALLGGTIGVLLWRVMCELWMVIFGIYDRLGLIREQLEPASVRDPA